MAEVIGDLEGLAEAAHRIARSEVRNIEAKAQRQAENIIEEARQQADGIHEQAMDQARHRAEAIRRQRLAEASQEARRRRLAAREEVLDQVWEQASHVLRDLPEAEDYAETLRQLAWLALDTLGPGDLVLAADPRGQEMLTEDRLDRWSQEASEAYGNPVRFKRAAEPLDTWGGMIAEKRGGRERIDARFPPRLEEARAELRDEVFQILARGQ